MKINNILLLLLVSTNLVHAHTTHQSKIDFNDKFRQLEEKYPDPNQYRPATGEPGKEYWQQKADYKISVSLDEDKKSIKGSEIITYHNNSPLDLKYIWLQLDQNIFKSDSIKNQTLTQSSTNRISFSELRRNNFMDEFDGGYKNLSISIAGKKARLNLVGTLVRVNLDAPLEE